MPGLLQPRTKAMTVYREWHDLVVYPLHPERVRTREQRLDTSEALDPESPGYSPGCKESALVTLRYLLPGFDDDVFEAMEVGDSGDVTIWTKKRVWLLWRPEGGLERFKFVLRYPPSAAPTHEDSAGWREVRQ